MSEAGERSEPRPEGDACASGAKPRPGGPVREHASATDNGGHASRRRCKEVAVAERLRAADAPTMPSAGGYKEAE
jgi:hypothetical protein